ncbi:bifunctional folylpolyglutamate synthase/dihydrofolate synthase [Rummeliibacillus sp. NPDC094406]|uniref:bifunctional folylpolyglutamate synthase/dihydrofolate synthase n=1 Tax=Rummeliibacillus sp. NPDC094406 TaxID=3364511 RepID=UPI0038081ABD
MIPKLDEYKERWHITSDPAIKPGLDAMHIALELVGNPQNNLPVIHLAGTNGKGSTSSFIQHIAKSHGLKTATFMSPCIEDVHDQIQLNEKPIEPKELDTIFKIMSDAGLDGKLTDFELLTVAAYIAFSRFAPDIAIIECGMGGRFDCTNVMTPIVSVVPSISLEHTNFLGDTLVEIAYHKAGIVKKERPIVIGALPNEALVVFEEEAAKQHAPLYVFGKDFSVETEGEYEKYISKDFEFTHLQRIMPGIHQRSNMALAITVFTLFAKYQGIQIENELLQNGVHAAHLAGRFEKLAPNLYVDGAHNPASAKALVETIKEEFTGQKIHFVIGMLKDKDVAGVLRLLEEVSTSFTFVDVDNERAMSAGEMRDLSHGEDKQISKGNIVNIISEKLDGTSIVVMTGSLYLLAKWRKTLLARFK